jgi:CheY-like chemotaxis protein
MARILIIDDNPDMLAMLHMFFERRTEHEILVAKTGREGLDIAFDKRPNVALVDVMMPRMDGYEVVRRLRTNSHTEKMIIIMLTARGQRVDQQAALQAGADLHLSKPVNMQTLAESVDTLLAQRIQVALGKTMLLLVLSLKGGVGTTTVATNLAALLQQVAPTILWDLAPTSGHGALFLGLEPKAHWGLYLRDPQKGIASLVSQHGSGLQILCAPPIPSASAWLTEAQIIAVMQSVRSMSTYVVVDMPPMLNPSLAPLIAAAEKILLVTGDDPPSIQTTLATLQALHAVEEKLLVIHNIRDAGRHLRSPSLSATLRIPVQGELPYDTNQELALSKGVPLALAKSDSPLVLGLQNVIQQLLVA